MPRLDLLNVVVLLGRLQPPDHVVHGIDELDDHDGVDIDDHGDVEIMLSMVLMMSTSLVTMVLSTSAVSPPS